MVWRYVFMIVLLFIVFFLEVHATYSSDQFKFAVYYGEVSDPSIFANYSIVILSPMLSAETIKEIKSYGVKTIAYLSLTTIGDWEPWSANVAEDMIVGEYGEWNEKVINISDQRWKKIILDDAIPFILSKGFDGVFLDNLDKVEEYPWMREDAVDLIKSIRERYPNLIIIVNRGFIILDDIAPYIDYFLFEDFGTYYNFSTGRYEKFSGRDLEWIEIQAKRLKRLSKEYRFKVLALAYADPRNSKQWREYNQFVRNLAEKYGLSYYISDVYLTYLPIQENRTVENLPSLEMKDKMRIYETVLIAFFLLLIIAIKKVL